MIVGSIHENLNQEKRVAMTPDVVKKYISLGIKVNLTKNYASHLGINDGEYEAEAEERRRDSEAEERGRDNETEERGRQGS